MPTLLSEKYPELKDEPRLSIRPVVWDLVSSHDHGSTCRVVENARRHKTEIVPTGEPFGRHHPPPADPVFNSTNEVHRVLLEKLVSSSADPGGYPGACTRQPKTSSAN